MFRKAKRLSQRLGINKERCTENSTNNNKINVTNENHKDQPIATHIDKALIDDNDTVSTQSSNDDESLKFPLKERPTLAKCQTEPNQKSVYGTPDNNLTRQLSMMDTGNLELLLSMETQARMDAQAKREQEQLQQAQEKAQESTLAPRPTKIKFELPVTPPRSRSPANPRLQYPRARPVRSLPEEGLTANALRHPLPNNNSNKSRRVSWRHLFGDRDDEDTKPISLPINVGSRVRLKLRPLPTFGYVRFIGDVDFDKEETIGVELDHGVGNCDGSMKGKRYFTTDANRGIFCKRRDLEAVPE
ncbi:hypothetical protein INT47_012440 [Mucor saturninus]|uniref:CAP-Gly domain-containing protein n=1 Tax=Mucor saturninus TaxID=64648 RepID=A0A8H7QWK6_9FUNG|nr:hypothetical protein INT47_012440 [Mucor saturninus]